METAFEEDIKQCVRILNNGGIILYPTDTIWGLGCDATNGEAVNRIFSIKQRPREKAMIVLLADARDIFKYVVAPPPDIIHLLGQFMEPTTVIYEHAIELPENVINANGTIAIRVTGDPFCKALIKRFQKPLISTSANLSGENTAGTYELLNKAIADSADYIVHYRRDDNILRKSSKIIKIDDEGNIETIR